MKRDLHDHQLERAAIQALADTSQLNVQSARTMLDQNPLEPGDFALPAHAELFSIARNLLAVSQPVEITAVAAQAKGLPAITSAGGAKWLAERLGGAIPVLEASFPGYVRTLRDLAVRRRAVSQLRSMAEQLQAPDSNAGEVLGRGAAELARMGTGSQRLKTAADHLLASLDRMEAVRKGEKNACIPTGIDLWDQVLGGLEPGVLTFIGGQAGVSKSGLLATMLRNTARAGMGAGLISLEDLGTWLPNRVLSLESAIPVQILSKRPRAMTSRDFMDLAKGAERAYPYLGRIVIDDRTLLSPEQIAQVATDMVLNYGATWIAIDNLSKVKFGAADRRDIAIGEGLNAWDAVAKRLHIPVVIVAHMKGSGAEAKYRKPELNDFAEALWIGRYARNAVGVYCERGTDDVRNVAVLKQTEGKGDVEIQLGFRRGAILFESENGAAQDLGYEDDARQLQEGRDRDMRRRAANDYPTSPEER